MNRLAIKKYLDNKFPKQVPNQNLVEEIDGTFCINGLCIMPVKLPYHYDPLIQSKIIDENGLELGQILFQEKETMFEVNSLIESNFSCLLIELETDEITESNYTFRFDYIYIKKEYFLRYVQDYKTKSPIWGGFFHKEDLPNNKFEKKISIPEIKAIKSISSLDNYKEILEMIVIDPNPFNRFLKLYHLLELQFDMHTAIQIKNLLDAGGKEKEISDVLRDYAREDIERLKSLFKTRIDQTKLEPFLNNILNHKQTSKKIFYYKEKESNPLRSETKFEKLFDSSAINQISFDSVFGQNWFENKIASSIAYWIYRVRNCIAHNKLGEYIITKDDEDFVVEFAEPLIREVVLQCYKQ